MHTTDVKMAAFRGDHWPTWIRVTRCRSSSISMSPMTGGHRTRSYPWNGEQSLQRLAAVISSGARMFLIPEAPQMPIALSHASMFPRPGSYITVEHPAGYPLFLILGKDQVLRGFHNVCRHRAYPVVSNKQAGCSPTLGCRYHGWSYNLQGHLTKAPHFDNLEGFDKTENSLFAVNVLVDAGGFVYVDVGAQPSPSQAVVGKQYVDCASNSWEMECSFNWKLAGNVLHLGTKTY